MEVLFDRCDRPAGWTLQLGREVPGAEGRLGSDTDAGRPCLRVDFDFARGGNYVGLERNCVIPESSEIAFSICATGSLHGIVRLHDATEQAFLTGFTLAGEGWQQVRVPITPERFRGHWSGANDGVFHFPMARLVIAMNGPGQGHFLLRDITLTTAAPDMQWRLRVDTPFPGNVAFTDEGAVPIHVRATNCTGEPVRGEVHCRILNYEGKTLLEQRRPLDFAKWADQGLDLQLPRAGPGYYLADAEVLVAGRRAAAMQGGICVVIRPKDMDRDDGQAFFGLHVSDPAAAQRIGARWHREWRFWRFTENHPGIYDWSDEHLRDCRAHHIQVMLVMDYEPPSWAAKLRTAGQKGWSGCEPIMAPYRDFVRECARRYRDQVSAFEIQNEPDLQCWRNNGLSFDEGVAEYTRLVQMAAPIVRTEAPGRLVAGCDVSGVDYDAGLPFSRAVLERVGSLLDVFSGHPYASPRYFGDGRHPLLPHENREAEKLQGAVKMLDEFARAGKGAPVGGPQRLWIGEKGWGLDLKEPALGPYSKAFAGCVAQTLITARSVAGADRYFWFVQEGCREQGCEYGLWRGDPSEPLPAAVAYATCARFLEHARPHRSLALSDSLQGFSFVSPDLASGVVALWSTGEELKLSPRWPRGARAYDLLGRELPPGAVIVGPAPVYLVVPQTQLEALCKVVEAQPLAAAQPVRVETVFISNTHQLVARLVNRTRRPVAAALRACGETASASIPPDGRAVDLPLAVKPSLASLNGKSLVAEVLADGKPVAARQIRVDLTPCPRHTLRVGAPFAEWGPQAVTLADRSAILPPDPTVGWKGPDDLSVDAWWGGDAENFYFGARVRDDVHSVPDAGPDGFWKSDSIQLALDTANDATDTGGYEAGDVEIGLVLGADGPHVYRTFPRAEGWPAVPVSIRREGQETLYQVALPWKLLGISPQPGKVFGFNFIVNDNDGAGRKYWMGLRPGIGEAKRPSAFMDLYLKESDWPRLPGRVDPGRA